MFLRKTRRKKDGKTHEYWSVVENRRVAGGRIVQRHVLYLGEINSSQAAVWRKAIEVLDDDAGHSRTMALFPGRQAWPDDRPVARRGSAGGLVHTRPGGARPAAAFGEMCGAWPHNWDISADALPDPISPGCGTRSVSRHSRYERAIEGICRSWGSR